jgi:hypothetical protein
LVDALGDLPFTFAVTGHRYLVSVVEAILLSPRILPDLDNDSTRKPQQRFMADGIARLIDALGDLPFTFAVTGHRYLVSVVEAILLSPRILPDLDNDSTRKAFGTSQNKAGRAYQTPNCQDTSEKHPVFRSMWRDSRKRTRRNQQRARLLLLLALVFEIPDHNISRSREQDGYHDENASITLPPISEKSYRPSQRKILGDFHDGMHSVPNAPTTFQDPGKILCQSLWQCHRRSQGIKRSEMSASGEWRGVKSNPQIRDTIPYPH